ncbi:hypothetical protein [Marinivivus vitaminiproducens]|uniref:hypothetical protein n=1 Tax=Marinivivus vitaminiproducens TaxID=3035935 RepID=UPI00279CBE01|nr:hypothetical protein P4R82_06525 [Geminicoccaceae bacterium SCSIO 64248]
MIDWIAFFPAFLAVAGLAFGLSVGWSVWMAWDAPTPEHRRMAFALGLCSAMFAGLALTVLSGL